ncbi:MAG: hypothetical protein J3T61_09140, partial [Candidatus Brocadiales bacterium]|nr:hypothetical protein [Candidatus Bathyanammoxibius sp.]
MALAGRNLFRPFPPISGNACFFFLSTEMITMATFLPSRLTAVSRDQRAHLWLVASFTLVIFTIWAGGVQADIIDQFNPRSPSGGQCYSEDFFRPLGQEFTPQLDQLDFVDLLIDDVNIGSNPDATYQVNIRDGTVAGPLLASSAVTVIPDGTNTGGGDTFTRFDFPSPVPLTPGEIHVIELFEVGEHVPNYSVCGSNFGAGTYPGGNAILQGGSILNTDLWFVEGVVSEPTTFMDEAVFDVEASPDGAGGFVLEE